MQLGMMLLGKIMHLPFSRKYPVLHSEQVSKALRTLQFVTVTAWQYLSLFQYIEETTISLRTLVERKLASHIV